MSRTPCRSYFRTELFETPQRMVTLQTTRTYSIGLVILFLSSVVTASQPRAHITSEPITQKLGEYETLVEYQQMYQQLQDSIHKVIAMNESLFHQIQFEVDLKDQQLVQKSSEIETYKKDMEAASYKRKLFMGIIAALLVLSILAGYIIWSSAMRKRNNLVHIIETKMKQLEAHVAELLSSPIVHHNGNTMSLSAIDISGASCEEELEKIRELQASTILTNEDWDVFKKKFTRVYPLFFTKIKSKGYVLTQSEERLLALEKLKLRTSEVANILGISPKSFLTSRYRLKKKLNIPKEACLVAFMEG